MASLQFTDNENATLNVYAADLEPDKVVITMEKDIDGSDYYFLSVLLDLEDLDLLGQWIQTQIGRIKNQKQ